MCSLQAAAKDLAELNVQILGASLDDVATQKAFADEHEVTFPLLSDPDGSVAEKYKALGGMGAFAKRITYIIGPSGKVRYVDSRINVATHGDDVARIIKKLQAR